MDSSADTAAWVAAIAAAATLVFAAVQIFGARNDRIRRHDIDVLERMLEIVSDRQARGINTPFDPTLFVALYFTLSRTAKDSVMTVTTASVDPTTLKKYLAENAGVIAGELLIAIQQRVGLKAAKSPPANA